MQDRLTHEARPDPDIRRRSNFDAPEEASRIALFVWLLTFSVWRYTIYWWSKRSPTSQRGSCSRARSVTESSDRFRP